MLAPGCCEPFWWDNEDIIRLIPQLGDQEDTQPIALVAQKATKLFNGDTIETNNLTNNSCLIVFF